MNQYNIPNNRNEALHIRDLPSYIPSLRTHQKCIKIKKTVFYAQKYNIALQICDI